MSLRSEEVLDRWNGKDGSVWTLCFVNKEEIPKSLVLAINLYKDKLNTEKNELTLKYDSLISTLDSTNNYTEEIKKMAYDVYNREVERITKIEKEIADDDISEEIVKYLENI